MGARDRHKARMLAFTIFLANRNAAARYATRLDAIAAHARLLPGLEAP